MGADERVLERITAEHLRYLERSLALGVWAWEISTDRLLWSAGLFQILGLQANTVAPSFELYRSVVHPEDQLDFTNKQVVATTGKLEYRRFRIIRPTGELRWIESHGQILFDRDGKAAQMIGFARDITDKKADLDRSAAYDAVMRAMRQLTGAQIWRTAPDGTIVDDANWWQSVARTYPIDDGRTGPSVADDLSEREFWAGTTEEHGYRRGHFRLKQADGNESMVSTVAVPVKAHDGKTIGWLGVSKAADLPEPIRYLAAEEVPAAQFRAARSYLDVPGEAFARDVGVSYSTIRRLESEEAGVTRVGSAVRQQVVDFLAQRGVRFTADSAGIAQMSITRMPDRAASSGH